jgi:hypothetical protein
VNFDQFWARLKLSNQWLDDDSIKVTMPVRELRRFMAKAFDAGYENRKKIEEDSSKLRPKSPFEDLFGGFHR